MNVTLRALWPLIFHRRPVVFVHNGYYRRSNGRLGARDRLKYWVARFATNIACSEAVARDLPTGCVVVPSPYDSTVFTITHSGKRPGDLLFVGRLVTEKGADLLLASLVELKLRGLEPKLTIVGSGPEEPALRRFCEEHALTERVAFCGTVCGDELATLMNRHHIMVVPSRNEGLGIVALEGIACGCLVIGSDAGGLPEAVGDCGFIFRSDDVGSLTDALSKALTGSDVESADAKRALHLGRFSPRAFETRYLEVVLKSKAQPTGEAS
jgi:glycosyltransferase involved in cell wall biosynthesis